jgi:hypothetical protein
MDFAPMVGDAQRAGLEAALEASGLRSPCMRRRRTGVGAALQAGLFLLQSGALAFERLPACVQGDAPLGGVPAVCLLRGLQQKPHRIVAVERAHPVGQRRDGTMGGDRIDGQLPEPREVDIPGVDMGLPLRLHGGIGAVTVACGLLGGSRLLVARLAAPGEVRLGSRNLSMAAADQGDVLAACGSQRAQA